MWTWPVISKKSSIKQDVKNRKSCKIHLTHLMKNHYETLKLQMVETSTVQSHVVINELKLSYFLNPALSEE